MSFKLDETYVVAADIPITVDVGKEENDFVKRYVLHLPEFGAGTRAMLNDMKTKIVTEVNISSEKMLDSKFVADLKKTFHEKAMALLTTSLSSLPPLSREKLASVMVNEMAGLGPIEYLLYDGNLEEIVVNSATEPVWVYHKKHGWLKTNITIHPEAEIQNYASIIARRVGKQVTILNPLLDAHLVTGDRANASLFPISSRGNTITIRRFRRDPWTATDFINAGTSTPDATAILWLAMEYELNIMVSGGTGSGKTTLLNVLLPFIQPNQRVLTIEDSVSGEMEILYQLENKTVKTTVGKLIDGIVEDDSIRDISIENDEGIQIPSMTKEGKIEWREPSHFIRHWVKKDLLTITFKSGRVIEVTPDHSLFGIGKSGQISEVTGKSLSVGSWLATPRELDWAGEKVSFNLRHHLSAFEGCFVRSVEIRSVLTENMSLLRDSYSKNTINGARRRGLASIQLLQQIHHTPSTGMITSRLGLQLPLDIEVDEDLATFVGLWLADGCYDKNSVLISVVEPEAREIVHRIAKRFGTTPKMHSDGVTLMIHSKPFKQFVERVMNLRGNAYTKKMPKWVFNLPKNIAAAVLRGYFSGDGWVRKNDIVVGSSSAQLLKDTQTLLLRFGISLRVKWKLKKDKTYESRISGQKFLSKFVSQIGFVINHKTEKAAKWLSSVNHDVSDVIPLPHHFYKEIKKALKVEVGVSRTYKGWKSYKYAGNIGRELLRKHVTNYPNLPKQLHDLAFNDLQWDQVVSIERRPFEGFVYDFSVPRNESFVCNNVVCHNTRELTLPDFLHWVPMTTREPNAEGKGGVGMLDLLVNALRMRPDRIIVGEVRRQREAEVMFEAMHTGHSVYATVHANTAEETIQRLTSPPIDIAPSLLEAVHLNAVMFRNRRLGVRRILQLAEFVPQKTGNEGKTVLKPNILFRWRAASDKIEKYGESIRLFDELALHTGFTAQELTQNITEKEKILTWMVKEKIRDINEVGRVMAEYYSNPDTVLKRAGIR
ncbi:MAG: ATPase, T2SS/T4P/T4SS family [Candidatus Diapherotrites archaeon]